MSPFETDLNDGSEENRGIPADAVQGKKDAEEDIATAEKTADEELQHLDQPDNALDADAAVDQTDEFRNPPRTVF